MLYVIDSVVEPTRLIAKKMKCMFTSTRDVVNGDVRPGVLQEIAGLL